MTVKVPDSAQIALLIVFTMLIFLFDLFVTEDITVVLLYCIVIVAVPALFKRHAIHNIAILITIFIVLGFFLSFREHDQLLDAVSRTLAIATVWIIAFIIRKFNEVEVLEKNIIETDTNGIIVVDETGRIELFNPAAEKIFDYSAEEVIGRNIATLVPVYKQINGTAVRSDISNKKTGPIKHEVEVTGRGGISIPVEITFNDFYIGTTRHSVSILHDIRARKVNEGELQREHAININLLNTARCIILYLDTDRKIVNFNPYFEEITGYKINDLKGMNWFDVFIPDQDKLRIGAVFENTMSGSNTDGTINPILTADGRQRTIIWSNTRILDKDGVVSGLLCCGQDITAQEFAQDHLIIRTQQLVSLSEIAYQALQEPQFQSLIQYILSYIINSLEVKKAAYFELSEVNNLLQIYSGTKSSHISYYQTSIPVILDSLAIQALTLNQPVSVYGFLSDDRYRKIAEINEQQYNSVLAVPIGSSTLPVGALCVYLDTEHKFTDNEINYLQSVANIISIVIEKNRTQYKAMLLSQEMLKLSRINLIGELGTYIAHEINQPLTALMNYLQSSKRLIHSRFGTLPESIEALMEKTLNEAERASSIIRNIRDYLESGQLHKTTEDLNKVIRETCDIISLELTEKKITLGFDLQQGLPLIDIDKLQIQQVLINIMHNSIKAMESSIIRQIDISTSCNSENIITIAIQDTGTGISPDLLDSKFQITPNTSKSGLGLGLSICKSIIEAHVGVCWFSEAKREGAMFNFTLPVYESEQSYE